MRRAVLIPLLAFFAVSCQDRSSTAPIPGPDFAKGGSGKPDCTVDPSHPKCKDGGDGEVAYTATDLGTLGGKRARSAGLDISDPLDGGTRVISGTSSDNANLDVAVRWEVNESGDVDGPTPLDMGAYSHGVGRGISDDGRIIVGYAGNMPVRWDGDVGWTMTTLPPYDGYVYGVVFDANNDGTGVGWSTDGSKTPVRVATLWDGSAAPVSLPNPVAPDGVSRAKAITSDGYVVGGVWDAAEVSSQAILWLPGGGWCLLGPGNAHGLTEVSDGTVLVAGTMDGTLAKVWEGEVNVNTCVVTDEWPLHASSFGWSENGDHVAFDVRTTAEGWEAAGMSADAPVVWTYDGEAVVGTRLASNLKARRINQDGEVVGRSKVKGVWHGILWTPSQP
jgi:uncharacterized membrane protein